MAMRGCGNVFSVIKIGRRAALLLAALCFICMARAEAGIESWSALQGAIDSAVSGDTIILTGNVKAGESDTALVIPDGLEITLDLNGFTLDRNLKKRVDIDGSAIRLRSGAMLTIMDSGTGPTGKIMGGYAEHGGGINNNGMLVLEGGCITGNTARSAGGGIVNYGILVVSGGVITGNSAGVKGGGIYNEEKGYVTIVSDTVFDNSAPRNEDIMNLGSVKAIGGETVELAAITAYLELLSILPVLALMLILGLSVHLDNYLDRNQKRIMYIICALVFALILQNDLENRLSIRGDGGVFRTLLTIYGYAVRPAILAMFLCLVRPGRRYRAVWVLVGFNAAIYLTALFSPLAFRFSRGHFIEGPLNWTCLIVSVLLLAYLFYLTVRVFHPRKHRETWIPVLVTAIIGASVALDYTVEFSEQPVSFLTIGIAISSVFYYVWLHLQFVREHEEALRAEQRIQIMMTQIQPHFLFNTLSTIRALCAKDPPTAIHIIERFSVYLRQNLDALDQAELIPLSRELEHTRIYLEIEARRFPNIRVNYDIQDQDCRLPALTIQPLVENAIRHGVRIRDDGVVNVRTRRAGDAHLIVIEDNGKGFDVNALKNDGGKHIGINNVKSRIEQMCGGTLSVDSRVGEGTTVTLRIPAMSANGEKL